VSSAVYRSLRNSSTVSPASRTLPPIVYASTGSCRGIVRNALPSDMTICLAPFCSALTARRCGMPGTLGTPSDLDVNLSHQGRAGGLGDSTQIFANRVLDIFYGFLLGGSLRPAARKTRTRHSKTLLGRMKDNFVSHSHQIYCKPGRAVTFEAPGCGQGHEDYTGTYRVLR